MGFTTAGRLNFSMPNPTDSTHATIATVNGLIADADRAMDSLSAARREACAEYMLRTRKMRDLKIALHAAKISGEELFDIAPLLSPEITRLLSDPTHAL